MEKGEDGGSAVREMPPFSHQKNEPLLEFLSCLATASFQGQSTAQALICLRTELDYYT